MSHSEHFSVGAMPSDNPPRTLRNAIHALYPHNHLVQVGAVIEPSELMTIMSKRYPRIRWVEMNGEWIKLPRIMFIRDGVNTCEFEAQGFVNTFTVTFNEKLRVIQADLRSFDPTFKRYPSVPTVNYHLEYQVTSWGLTKPYRFPEGWLD